MSVSGLLDSSRQDGRSLTPTELLYADAGSTYAGQRPGPWMHGAAPLFRLPIQPSVRQLSPTRTIALVSCKGPY